MCSRLAVVLDSMRGAWDSGLVLYMTYDTGLIHTHRHVSVSSPEDGYGAFAQREEGPRWSSAQA